MQQFRLEQAKASSREHSIQVSRVGSRDTRMEAVIVATQSACRQGAEESRASALLAYHIRREHPTHSQEFSPHDFLTPKALPPNTSLC